MNKNDADAVIKETIEYANSEIEKNRKKTHRNAALIICAILAVMLLSVGTVTIEFPVKYKEGLLLVNIPVDEGLDINVNLNNYKSGKGILIKQDDDTYDLYIGITQTLYTKIIKNDDYPNLIRAGNQIVVDYKSEKLIAYMSGDSTDKDIMHVYYIDNLTDEIMCMSNSELINYANKTLVWTR